MSTDAQVRVWRTVEPPPRYRSAITAAVVLGIVVALVLALGAWQRWATRAPYGPDAVDAQVTMRLVPEAQAQAAVDALAGPGALQIPVGMGPLLVGQVAFDVPSGARQRDFFSLFLLDALQQQPLTQVWGSAPDGWTAQGWDGSYDAVAAQVPWLAGIASTQEADGSSTETGQAVTWSAATGGPVTFVAVPLEGMLEPGALASYTVGLALQDEDRALLWAQQLSPTAP